MSITSRINEMSSHIEQTYDELQGLGADLTNVNKNIENISMVLDDIYDSMPQVSGEGTSLTLDDTRVGKIKSTLKGNTSQSGTPTPTSPIPVNVVSGDNEINVVGKNLIPTSDIISTSGTTSNGITFTRNSDGSITANGTATGAISIYINNDYTELSAGTYTFSDSVASGESGTTFFSYADVRHTDSTGWDYYNFSTANTTTGMTQTIPEAFKFKTRIVIRNGQTLNNVVFKPMLEVGSSATTYKAYQGNTYNIDLPVENLCNGINQNVYLNNPANQCGIASNNSGLYIPVNGGNYTISTTTTQTRYRVACSNGVPPSEGSLGAYNGQNKDNTSSSITIDTTGYTYLIVNATDLTKIQIEKGSKTNSYTPYGTTPIELCKIGNYQDYFGKSDGRNLFDKDKDIVEGYTFGNDDILISATDFFYQAYYIPVEPNTTYSFIGQKTLGSDSLRVCEYTSDKTFIQRNYELYTITTTQNTHYIRVSNYKDKLNTTQVEKSSSATPWQPYGVGKWYLHKEIGKVVLNGSSNRFTQIFSTNTSGINRYRTNEIPVKLQTTGQIADVYCNKLLPKTLVNTYGRVQGISVSDAITMFIIYIDDIGTYTLEQANNWLSTNNLEIYYVLATSTNTEVTYEPLITQLNLLEKAMSKDGQTNISQVNNDLPFIISASALKEWQESTSLNSTLNMVKPLSLGNTLNTQENNIQPIEADNIEPLEEEENEES